MFQKLRRAAERGLRALRAERQAVGIGRRQLPAVAHKVERVPLIVANGRYMMNGAVPPRELFANTDLVIAKARAETMRK